jgi:hypothetical protein
MFQNTEISLIFAFVINPNMHENVYRILRKDRVNDTFNPS